MRRFDKKSYHQSERIPHKDPDRVVPSSDVGVKPRQPEVLELSGISFVSLWDQNTWVEQARTAISNRWLTKARTVAHTPEKSRPFASKPKRIYAQRIISDHIMVAEDFERLHKFLLEMEYLSEVSDDMRELVEEEWPELVHKLPPKAH